MPRPRMCRRINFRPKASIFKPQGVPLRFLDYITVTHEEMESLRLKYIENLDQETSAKQMKTSQSTFQRILASANKKTAKALIEGKAISMVK